MKARNTRGADSWYCFPVLLLAAVISGCVGSRVELYTDTEYPTNNRPEGVKWLVEAPSLPYLELGRIIVSSTNAGDETLRHSLLERARRLGADAVIPETNTLIASDAPTPYYDRGILGPKGAAFGLYGYGWYSPYSSNPYILDQGAVDQPRIERYISAIAIRYQSEPDQHATP